jgi:hypothetical protein
MKQTLYFRLLEHLSKNGIGVKTNIKPILCEEIGKDNTPKEFSEKWADTLAIVKFMIRSNHISTYLNEIDLTPEQISNSAGGVIAWLTHIGSDYYSGALLTKRTIRNFTWTRWLTLSALGVSIFSTWYAVYKSTDLETKLRLQQTQLQNLKSQVQKQSVSIVKKIDTIHISASKKP